MERPYPAVEFESEITAEGMIIIPPAIAVLLPAGRQVTVRITGGIVSRSLRERGITEAIIEQVSELQLEDREHVVEFFRAEQALATDTMFKRRASRLKRRNR